MMRSHFDISGDDDLSSWSDGDANQPEAETNPVTRSVPDVYSLREVALLFGRSERTINNWVRAGHLKRGGFGNAVFFTRAHIDAFLNHVEEDSEYDLSNTT